MALFDMTTKAVAVGFCFFMLGVFIGSNNGNFRTTSTNSNLRSTGIQGKQPMERGNGLALPAHMEAPKTFRRMDLFSRHEDEDEDEIEDFSWPGMFAHETFVTLAESYSFSFDFDD